MPLPKDVAACCTPYRLTVWFASASYFPMATCANPPGGHIGNVEFFMLLHASAAT
jgi:hypothetical protein